MKINMEKLHIKTSEDKNNWNEILKLIPKPSSVFLEGENLDFISNVYDSGVEILYETTGIILGCPKDPRHEVFLETIKKCVKEVFINYDKNFKTYQQKAIKLLEDNEIKFSVINKVSKVEEIYDLYKLFPEVTQIVIPEVDINQNPLISEKELKTETLKYDMKCVKFGFEYYNNLIFDNKQLIITKDKVDLRPIKIIKIL